MIDQQERMTAQLLCNGSANMRRRDAVDPVDTIRFTNPLYNWYDLPGLLA